MKVKIEDVAKKAGVSTATVDRVLNRRGNVRQATIDKVEKAVLALSYEPNLLASRLAKGKIYHLGFILPLGENHFMEALSINIKDLSLKLKNENIIIHREYINIWAEESADALLKIASQWDGLVLVAADTPRMNLTINKLCEKMPVVTLVSDAPLSKRLGYVGIDNLVAGRTAASLIGRFLPLEPTKIAVVMGSAHLRDHAERKAGFEQVIQNEYAHISLLPPIYALDDYRKVEKYLTQLYQKHPDFRGIYSLGAGNRGLIKFLKNRQSEKNIKVVAHELTDVSRKALIDNCFDAILCQNSKLEVEQAVQILVYTLEGKNIQNILQRSNVEIYLRDNLPS